MQKHFGCQACQPGGCNGGMCNLLSMRQNGRKSEKYVDLFKSGIIDPKKVTRVALENAASVAGMILTTECALVDIKEDTPAAPPMGGGGMPGMM